MKWIALALIPAVLAAGGVFLSGPCCLGAVAGSMGIEGIPCPHAAQGADSCCSVPAETGCCPHCSATAGRLASMEGTQRCSCSWEQSSVPDWEIDPGSITLDSSHRFLVEGEDPLGEPRASTVEAEYLHIESAVQTSSTGPPADGPVIPLLI